MATITGEPMRVVDTRAGKLYLGAQAVLLVLGIIRLVTESSGRVPIVFAIVFVVLIVVFVRTLQAGVRPVDDGYLLRRITRRGVRFPTKPRPTLELARKALLGSRIVLIDREGRAHATDLVVSSSEELDRLGWATETVQPRGSRAS